MYALIDQKIALKVLAFSTQRQLGAMNGKEAQRLYLRLRGNDENIYGGVV